MKRRQFLRQTAAIGGSAVFGSLLGRLSRAQAADSRSADANLIRFDDRTEILAGFECRSLSPLGAIMDDGVPVPELHDGMGVFGEADGGYTLVRNHEIADFDRSQIPRQAWDPACRGGTTTVRLNSDLTLREHYLSLTGTLRNCSGGTTPWGTWLSCEERFDTHDGVRHGYVFEVDPRTPNTRPQPLVAMGRFEHEACAWEPEYGHIYMTEDRNDGNLYRFKPDVVGELARGGRLQALGLLPLSETALACRWIDVEEPDPARDEIRHVAQGKGAAVFRRPEGLWRDHSGIYFSTTAGGRHGLGEIFHYKPTGHDEGVIRLVFESGRQGPAQPDALTRTPGDILLVCEDNDRAYDRVLGLTPDGQWFTLARGRRAGWTGITFSPDNRVLFINQQYVGTTLAITGDWSALAGS